MTCDIRDADQITAAFDTAEREVGLPGVLWFNRLARASGDLREEKAASESLDALLFGFPGTR